MKIKVTLSIPKVLRGVFIVAMALATGIGKLHADFDANRLARDKTTNRAAYDRGLEAMTKAVNTLSVPSFNRVKLPGSWNYNLEGTYKIAAIKELYLSNYSTDTETTTHAVGLKMGAGLPEGFYAAAGINRVVTENIVTSLHAEVAYQVLDFATIVYSDLVPAMVVHLTAARNLTAPALYSFGGTLSMGVYHRSWPLEIAYGFSGHYTIFLPVVPDTKDYFLSHTLSFQCPIWWKLYVRAEMGIPNLQASTNIGLDF